MDSIAEFISVLCNLYYVYANQRKYAKWKTTISYLWSSEEENSKFFQFTIMIAINS